MESVRVYDLLRRRVLVTRESARSIGPTLSEALGRGDGRVELDFSGVEGITPSFLDEALEVIQEQLNDTGGELQVLILNAPTRLSSKFEAVGRGRGLSITESPEGRWLVVSERSSAAS